MGRPSASACPKVTWRALFGDLPSLIVAFEASSYALKADVLAGNIKKRLSLITLQCFETAPSLLSARTY
jgi:hypothetical protein